MSKKGKEAEKLYLESLVSQLTGWNEPELRIQRAFEQDEFILFGQHIAPLDAKKGLPAYIEILVRLREEERNLTPPGAFIPILEYFGMMPDLDRWVIEHALDWWRLNSEAQNSVMSINLSPDTLNAADFPQFVEQQLRKRDVSPRVLCFELSQDDILAHSARFARATGKLNALGCGFAVSSFGHGSVSFQALQAIPSSLVKIDGGIIREILRDKLAVTKVRSIHQVCRKFSIRTVAELVEHPDTLKLLQQLDVDYAQGYGVSRPGPLR